MRKSDTNLTAATTAMAAGGRDAPAQLVCLALLLALTALACRIATIW